MTKLTNIEAANLHAACAEVTAAVDIPFKARYAIGRTFTALAPAVKAFNEARGAALRRLADGKESMDAEHPNHSALMAEWRALDAEVVDVDLHAFAEEHLGEPKIGAAALGLIAQHLVIAKR